MWWFSKKEEPKTEEKYIIDFNKIKTLEDLKLMLAFVIMKQNYYVPELRNIAVMGVSDINIESLKHLFKDK